MSDQSAVPIAATASSRAYFVLRVWLPLQTIQVETALKPRITKADQLHE